METNLLEFEPKITITFNDAHHDARAAYESVTKMGTVIVCDDMHVMQFRFAIGNETSKPYTLTAGGYHSLSFEIFKNTMSNSGFFSTPVLGARTVLADDIERAVHSAENGARKVIVPLRPYHHIIKKLHEFGVIGCMVVKRRGNNWFPKTVSITVPVGVSVVVAGCTKRYIEQLFKYTA